MKHRCVIFLVFFWFHLQVLARDGFIKKRGAHFIKDGSYYYANGFNAYWLMFVASNPAQRDRVTSAFQEAASHGLTVARAWAFSDGGYQPLQFSPGIYNEQMFQGLDFVLYEARRYGIQLILSLVNNWKDFGGKSQYVQWARDQGQNITADDDFFTNAVVKGFYRNHVQAILTRLNSITGVAYKDDKTIMAWELINEPRCNSDSSGSTLQAWITEMASYLKSVDRKHLLEIGLEGFYGESATQEKQFNLNIKAGTDFIKNNKIRAIDFATIHSYPDQWFLDANDTSQRSFSDKWISTHIHDAQKIIRKPLLLTEFGWNTSGFGTKTRDGLFNSVYSKIYSSARRGGAASGSMFWQLLAQGLDSFRDNYGIVLSERPTTARVIAKQSRKLTRLRDINARERKNTKQGQEIGGGL